jgi:hypothetical protein
MDVRVRSWVSLNWRFALVIAVPTVFGLSRKATLCMPDNSHCVAENPGECRGPSAIFVPIPQSEETKPTRFLRQ